jgi:hypothetical protein
MSDPNAKRVLMEQEEREWIELQGLVDAMPANRVEEPGYFVEGWSAKDLIGHIGSWLAEAGVVLEQIRAGTYRPDEIDIDEMNRRFYAALHDIPFPVIKAQAFTARNQMLRAWARLPEGSDEADRWISKSGPEHYEEHLPRLREWVGELAR